MNRRLVALVGLAVVALIVSSSQAQPPRGPRGLRGPGRLPISPVRLLMNESVRKEIKVSDEQMQKIREMMESLRPENPPRRGERPSFQDMTDEERQKLREEMQERRAEMQKRMEGMQKKAAEILDKDQMKRLQQINLQAMGPGLLRNDRVTSALKLTEEQQTKCGKPCGIYDRNAVAVTVLAAQNQVPCARRCNPS